MSQLAGRFCPDFRPISYSGRPSECCKLDTAPQQVLSVHHAPGLLMLASCDSHDCGIAVSDAGSACAWDGRLDNRAELLGSYGPLRPNASDARIALAVYEAKRHAGLRELIGDWSLVLWDARSKNLLLASDFAGVRPLYYCLDRNQLLWSSSLRSMAEWAGLDDLDEQYIAEFLSRGYSPGRTPYRRVYPVRSGQLVQFSSRGLTVEPFWQMPTAAFAASTGDDREYEEEFRRLFSEAVRVRMPDAAPVCAELSGGLDSSSIVCMADRLLKEGAVDTRSLTTLTYCHPGSTDEKYFRAVEQTTSRPRIHIEVQEHPLVKRDRVGQSSPAFWEPRFLEVSRCMSAPGSKVLLTGQLGDLTMGNWLDDSEQVSDLIGKFRLCAAVREALAWSQSLHVPVYPILWRAIASHCSASGVAAKADFAAGNMARDRHGDSFTASFRKRTARPQVRRAWLSEVSPGRRNRLLALAETLESRVLQCPETLQHVSYTHPFSHRPLVEFMMSIPAAVVCGPGRPRRLMRKALAGIVPDVILERRSKATYNTLFLETLRPMAADLLRQPGKMRLVQLGYVDRESVRNRLERFTGGLDCNEHQLRQLILLEYWISKRGPSQPVTATA